MFSRIVAALFQHRKHLDDRKRRVGARKATEEMARFRPGLESLEARHLLASAPVAFVHSFATPLNTNLVITHSSSTNLLTSAFDVDGASLTSTVVGSPSHGTITSSGSDGAFSYTPTTGFSGMDSFTYRVSNASEDSPVILPETFATISR